jgi:type II secretory pathway pseudopilin PulG
MVKEEGVAPTPAKSSAIAASPRRKPANVEGFSLVEALIVVTLVGLLAALALPALSEARAKANLAAARDAFAAAHALARQVAPQYGRLARLWIDPPAGRFWVTVDTSTVPDRSVLDTVGPLVDVGSRFGGVRLDSNRRALCFDPNGLGTAAVGCELPNATVIFRRRGFADTVTTSRLGRLLKR